MTTPAHGWDQSWSYLAPKDAKAAGLGVVAGYLSYTPSKNLTADDVKAYHKAGIGVILNWESSQGAPLDGAARGHEHGAAAKGQAEALFAAVGYRPKNKPAIYFSCDQDVSPSQFGAIDDYYRATKAELVGEFRNGVYGEASLVDHLHAAGLTDSEWQTLAWSAGAVYQGADYYQSAINQKVSGADIDFDEVRHARQLGAWWPPGHPLDTAKVIPPAPVPVPDTPKPHRHRPVQVHHWVWTVNHMKATIARLRARLNKGKNR